jgi:glycosyltransferase involved in cell wall biosynthesis
VRFQRQAEIMAYPCTYDELFCIAAAECQVAGALPVYHPAGALPTTAEYGIAIPGIVTTPDFVDRFADRIGSLLTGERSYLGTRQAAMVEAARRRFDWNNIAAVWESVLEKGEQPYVKPSPYRAPEAGL